MSPPHSRSLVRCLAWGVLLALALLPVAAQEAGAARLQSATEASASPAVSRADGTPTPSAGEGSGVRGLPGGGQGIGSNPVPEDGDPDDFGCHRHDRIVKFLLTEVYFMLMWL
ncbi:MAG: hypothetical protein FJY75_09285 [Candidatus Eisenbacteria bacterium]|uniref:Uncharacterized protein n=1 Tax=Eiseniibacteriota bacterium TaxID=2212470 RepID=A0A938BR67_UNCEI|nr:hypothetical protein [Candidatus Eisenbacteria bacterium]